MNQVAQIVHLAGSDKSAKTVCLFPAAGSGPAQFKSWCRLMPTDMRLLAVLYPGHESELGQQPISSIDELVSIIFASLHKRGFRNLALFGHSFGAQLAFEVAVRLQKRSPAVLNHLFVAAARAPHLRSTRSWSSLTDDVFLSRVSGLGSLNSALLKDHEIRSLLLPMLRADFEMAETYCRNLGSSTISIPITALHGRNDAVVRAAEVQEWTHFCTDHFTLHAVHGGHFFVSEKPGETINIIHTALHRHRSGSAVADTTEDSNAS